MHFSVLWCTSFHHIPTNMRPKHVGGNIVTEIRHKQWCTFCWLFFVYKRAPPLFGRVAQSVKRLTMGWTVRGSNPGGAIFSARQDRPWSPRSLLYNGYRVFPGGKVRPGRAADHSPPPSAVVMEEYRYTSNHPLGHNRAGNGDTFPLVVAINIVHYHG